MIKEILFIPAAFFIFILLTGCTKSIDRYYPVMDNSSRTSSLGFVVKPPPGSNWFEKSKEKKLSYYKKTDPGRYTISASAVEIIFDRVFSRPQDFMLYVKNRKKIPWETNRYQNISSTFNFSSSPSMNCVEYNLIYKDYTFKNIDKDQFVLTKHKGRFCQHPKSRKIGIDISYKEMSLANSSFKRYTAEGESFISNLAFL